MKIALVALFLTIIPATGGFASGEAEEMHSASERSQDDILDRLFADRLQFAASLIPGRTFVRVGQVSSETFPDALTLRVSKPLPQSTFFTIETFDESISVSDVGILAGDSSGPVLVSATALGTFILGIEVDGVVSEAQVRVLGLDALPESLVVQPSELTLQTNSQVEFALTSDIPAPPGGTELAISSTVNGLIPATVTIAENETTVTVPFTAPPDPDTGTITWTISGTGGQAEAQIDVISE